MRKYKAKLIGLSDSIEEEVVIDINGTIILGFSTVCPYKIYVEEEYPVELHFTFLEAPHIKQILDEKYDLQRIGNSYSYILYGKVFNGSLDIGNNIKIADEYFEENSYLDGSFVEVIVDRITVDFLPK